jgi:selenocysteine lyase/cysteine desulfurase
LRVLREGGTGVRSEEPFTPETFPEGYEAGTPNGPGIYALMKGIEVIEKGYREERKEEVLSAFLEELSTIPGLTIYSQKDPKKALPLVSFRIEGVPCQSLAIALSEQYGFMVRAGLHCAPHAHKTIGTLDTGLVRVSFGPKIRKETARKFRDALREILQVGGIRAEKR